jgi:hypothetical protein
VRRAPKSRSTVAYFVVEFIHVRRMTRRQRQTGTMKVHLIFPGLTFRPTTNQDHGGPIHARDPQAVGKDAISSSPTLRDTPTASTASVPAVLRCTRAR